MSEPAPSDSEKPILHEHFRELARWVIGDAIGDRLGSGDCDALAEEIAAVLASGLAPTMRREIELQAEKAIAGMQNGPVSFDHDHQVRIDGFSVPEVVKLIDAAGRLVEAGVGPVISELHETHQRTLYRAHDAWRAKNGLLDPESAG